MFVSAWRNVWFGVILPACLFVYFTFLLVFLSFSEQVPLLEWPCSVSSLPFVHPTTIVLLLILQRNLNIRICFHGRLLSDIICLDLGLYVTFTSFQLTT
jgi:hypothetical protein